MRVPLVTQSAVSAGVSPRLVQIDENLRMTELVVPAVAPNDSRLDFLRRHLRNQVDGKVRVDLPLGVRETGETVVVLVPNDASVGWLLGDVSGFGRGRDGGRRSQAAKDGACGARGKAEFG